MRWGKGCMQKRRTDCNGRRLRCSDGRLLHDIQQSACSVMPHMSSHHVANGLDVAAAVNIPTDMLNDIGVVSRTEFTWTSYPRPPGQQLNTDIILIKKSYSTGMGSSTGLS